MTDNEPTTRHLSGLVKDARGKKVKQLDPVAMRLLGSYETIDKETLIAITSEDGVNIKSGERATLLFGVFGALLVICIFTFEAINGGLASARIAKSSGLIYLCSFPWIIWYGLKRKRFAYIAAAMLKYKRCPHCGYDISHLPVDTTDQLTVCPECGCAWQLGNSA